MPPSIEPTKTEKRNGWSAERLREYIAQREKAAVIRIFARGGGEQLNKRGNPIRRFVTVSTKKFNAHRWGKKRR